MALRRTTQLRRSREWDVIDVASKHLNTMGVSLEWFTSIAAELGISRPALYNHIENRDDLQSKCYLRTIRYLDQVLDAAADRFDRPDAVLEGFLEGANQPGQPELAVVREIDALPDDKRIQVRAEFDALVSRVSAVVQRGVSAGAFRPLDTDVIARAFVNMAGWLPIYRRWTLGGTAPHPTRGAKEILFLGLAADRHAPLIEPPRLVAPTTIDIDVFDRRSFDDARREGILGTASGLFNRRGIGATRVEDVGDAVGLSKRAMFHHVDSKTALVDACLARASAYHLGMMAAAEASPAPRVEALFAAIRDYVENACDPRRCVLVADVGAGLVSKKGWLAMADFHRHLTDGYHKILSDGQREGTIRPVALEDVQPCLPRVIDWVSGSALSNERERRHLADELATLVVRGICN